MYLKKLRKQFEDDDIDYLGVKLGVLLESKASLAPAQTVDPNCNKDSPGHSSRTKFEFLDSLPSSSCYRPGPLGCQNDDQTAIRPAEYIGSFSAQGSDQKARVDFVQKQLEGMIDSQKRKRVSLVISMAGIKVCSSDGTTVYMAHALKRISYATCDPEARQFSFMAREPEGETDIQFCHAFITKTPEKAEELNAIISNAFKMAYAKQREKPPTFHELIAQQVTEQQAHFRAVQEQAQQVLQEKLTAIARPTPFSETARQRMEMRKQQQQAETSSLSPQQQQQQTAAAEQDRDLVVGKNKVWAKQTVDKVKHRSSGVDHDAKPNQNQSASSSPSSSSSSPPLSSTSKSSATPMTALKTALQAAAAKYNPLSPQTSSPSRNSNNNCVVSSLQYHPLSAAAIKESLENSNNCNKFKGSPVTALKDEIDRHFLCNGMDNGVGGVVGVSPLGKGRPSSQSPHRSAYHRSSAAESFGRSEMELPASCCNPMANRPLPAVPHSHEHLLRSPAHRAALQNRRSFDDYNLSPSASSSRLRHNGESPRRKAQRPMSAIVTSGTIYDNPANGQPYSRTGTGGEEDHAGQYVYGPNVRVRKSSGEEAMYRQSRSPNRRKSGGKGSAENGTESEHVVLRYQNASPFQADRLEEAERSGGKSKPGLESLMCLDRSHIEDESLRHAPWYQAGIPREIALEILQQEDVGSFIVRDSTTHPGCFALSVRVPKFENANGISHYLVLKTQRGVKLKGLDKEWSNLTALVTHHTVMREMLPCTLRLPRKAKNPMFRASDKDDREDDPDYQRLSDFSSMMAQLKM
ncbi:uncharacterized protein LOC121390269 [Gigantopelta aegis]|uniref:uncharacterized protein LOC121390269 n=1 Tax=Gigantopelta aegis TaxID=1735272 RepID=UPI001B88AE58|nr:uncharacterized protein LOC121390269 [Gigantopelta aegis]